jgi:hypothetical protein
MITSPNMGLLIWNSSTDAYNSEEQAENWAKVDQHDHTPGKGTLITTGAIADAAITGAKLAPDAFGDAVIPDDSVTAAKLTTDSVTTAKIVNANVTDAKLAAPNNSIYRTVFHGSGRIPSGAPAATYIHQIGFDATATRTVAVNNGFSVPYWVVASTDYTSTLTTKVRIRGSIATTGTPPGMNFTFGIHALTIAAGAYSLAAASGNTAVVTGPAANAITSAASTDSNLPANNPYALGITTSGSSSAAVEYNFAVQIRHT